MPRKTRRLSFLDLPATLAGGGGSAVGGAGDDDVLPPVPPEINAPDNLQLTTGVVFSTASPSSYINATWEEPYDAQPDYYLVQVSTSSSFTASGTITAQAPLESARIEGLLPATLYYVRVRAVARGLPGAWSATASITTASDTTAAGVPTSISATWIGYGDLLITWTNPTEANLKDVQVVVRASSGGTIYRTAYSAAQRFLYTLAMNMSDTAGVGDSSLYVELKSRTFSNVLGTTVNTGLVTKSAPAQPTSFAQSWSGDTGTAGADLIMSWASAVDAQYWTLTLNGVAHRVGATRYTYTFAANKAQNTTPDPTITYSLVAVDGFGQASTAVSGTATNAAPAAPTATLTQGAVSGLLAAVTSTPPADFWRYEYVFKRDATTVATVYSTGASYRYEMQDSGDAGYHSWTVVVRQQDLFEQFSATHTPAPVAFEALTLAGLRAGISYSDSISTAAATLKTAMADDVRDSGGVSYAA